MPFSYVRLFTDEELRILAHEGIDPQAFMDGAAAGKIDKVLSRIKKRIVEEENLEELAKVHPSPVIAYLKLHPRRGRNGGTEAPVSVS